MKSSAKLESNEVAIPSGISRVGNGSLESFKDKLGDAVRSLFGKDQYVYITATFRNRVIVSVESKGGGSDYYEVPYKVTKIGFEFGTYKKVEKVIKFQKAEQEFRKSVKNFINGSGDLGEAVRCGFSARREILCKPAP